MTTNMRYTRHDTVKFLHIEGMTMTATETLGDEDDSQLIPEAGAEGKECSPWARTPPVEPPPPSAQVDGVVSVTIPDEILADPNTLWCCYVVGYFIGDAHRIGSIHVTVNSLWSSPKWETKSMCNFSKRIPSCSGLIIPKLEHE